VLGRHLVSNQPKADRAPPPRSVTSDTLWGAFGGSAVAALCLGVGLLRALFALLSGHHINPLSAADVRLVAYYVGAFVVVGAGLGAAKPLLRTRAGAYLTLALAGAVLTTILGIAFVDQIPAAPRIFLLLVAVFGAILGCGFARGWLRARS
jgi:hypothetical protein